MANVGRPTDYKPEYCQMLYDHLAEGLSYQSFGGVVGCSIQTLYDWEKANPEFLDAKQRGIAASMVFWERLGRSGTKGEVEHFKTASWIYTMKCRFGRHGWMEPPQQIESSNTNVNTNANINLDDLPLEKKLAILKMIEGEDGD